MNFNQQAALAFLALTCCTASANLIEWLDDWYEIEVIVFLQPEAIDNSTNTDRLFFDAAIDIEDLIKAAPKKIDHIARAFPLTEKERQGLRERSADIDLTVGSDLRFSVPNQYPDVPRKIVDAASTDLWGTFPAWLLPPEESYDLLFGHAFAPVPFGTWFTELSLNSFVDMEDEIDENLAIVEGSNLEARTPDYDLELELQEVTAAIEAFRKELREQSFTMNERDIRLRRTVARLRASGATIIKHFKWRQALLPHTNTPERVFFQALDRFPTEGYFGVSKGQFIHFTVHLWLHIRQQEGEHQFPVIELKEQRRMKPKDVHYFDHPKFGLIAEVLKVSLSPDLQNRLDALDDFLIKTSDR